MLEKCSKTTRKVLRIHLGVDDHEFLVIPVSPAELRELDANTETVEYSAHPKLRFCQLGGSEKQRDKGKIMGHEISTGYREDSHEVGDRV